MKQKSKRIVRTGESGQKKGPFFQVWSNRALYMAVLQAIMIAGVLR